jgi:ABC-type lipoprotein export system ATPase subunit
MEELWTMNRANDPCVRMTGVGRTYLQGRTSIDALVAATCAVAPRQRIAVVGPSGSGKSTLLHLMGGIDTPTAGVITWPALGERESLRPLKVAFVFQAMSLLAPLTALENASLPLLLSGVKGPAAREAAFEALAAIGLEGVADSLPEELSGGQAQRVAVARALASRPSLILADEPTGQLDHPTAQELFDVLLERLEETDTALVVATHDAAIARRMRTVWRVHHGRLEVSE